MNRPTAHSSWLAALVLLGTGAGASAQVWVERAKLTAPQGARDDRMGWGVALDDQTRVVGVPYDGLGFSRHLVLGLACDPSRRFLHGIEAASDQLVGIDPGSGITRALGPTHANLAGLAFDPNAGILYAVDSADDDLYAVAPETGAVRLVGPLLDQDLRFVQGLAFDPNTNTLYGVDTTEAKLATIDTRTGAGTVVGDLGPFKTVAGLAFDSNAGVLYASDTDSDQLLRIDTATGVATAVGPLGFLDVDALGFDAATNTLYGWDAARTGSHNGPPGGQLLEINPRTGRARGMLDSPYVVEARGLVYIEDIATGAVTLLTPSDPAAGDRFGFATALAGDTLFVSAPDDDDNSLNSGSVYVFERQGPGLWTEVDKLLASDGAVADQFGVHLSVDGGTLCVSAIRHDAVGLDAGALYMFERDASGTWNEAQKITPSNTAKRFFGNASIEGNRMAVGQSSGEGRVYVFERASTPSGGLGPWQEVAVLTADNGSPPDQLGISVALFGDTIAAGAIHADAQGKTGTGSAYVFKLNANGVWKQRAQLAPAGAKAGDFIGIAVALEADTLLVGATGDGKGTVTFFQGAGANWTEVEKLKPSTPVGSSAPGSFGFQVALWGDTALIGDYSADGHVPATGAAFVFDR